MCHSTDVYWMPSHQQMLACARSLVLRHCTHDSETEKENKGIAWGWLLQEATRLGNAGGGFNRRTVSTRAQRRSHGDHHGGALWYSATACGEHLTGGRGCSAGPAATWELYRSVLLRPVGSFVSMLNLTHREHNLTAYLCLSVGPSGTALLQGMVRSRQREAAL